MDRKQNEAELKVQSHKIRPEGGSKDGEDMERLKVSSITGTQVVTETSLLRPPSKHGSRSRSKRSSASESFEAKLSSNFEELEFVKDDESDRYDSNGKKKTLIRRTSVVETSNTVLVGLKDRRDLSAPSEGTLGGFEDIVHTVKIHEDELHEVEGE